MFLSAMRLGIAACTVVLAGAPLSNAALARELYAARGYSYGLPAYRAVAAGLVMRPLYNYYGYPLDDSYDYPRGYGEYAVYGPWAYQGYSGDGCQLTQRRVRTAYGMRWQTARSCY